MPRVASVDARDQRSRLYDGLNYKASHTKSPTSVVVSPILPAARDNILAPVSFWMASITYLADLDSPSRSRIILTVLDDGGGPSRRPKCGGQYYECERREYFWDGG